MDPHDYEARYRNMLARAYGHWTRILIALGVDERILNRRNQPCPLGSCGGTDRFQYDDRFGEGNYHCRSCGAGGGFKLAMGVLGWDAHKTLREVENFLGLTSLPTVARPVSTNLGDRMRKLARNLWQEAMPITIGDEVDRYLTNRGINLPCYPKTLRFHPSLGYYEKEPRSGRAVWIRDYPAMLACVQGPDAHAVTLHRTYLEFGQKALGIEAKKLLSGGIDGAAVRLAEATEELAVCEGIENGLATMKGTGHPVWAGISASNLEKLWIPDCVRHLRIYGDNDANAAFDGQASAYVLARRFKKGGSEGRQQREVEVFIPRHAGTDWAEVWLASIDRLDRAA